MTTTNSVANLGERFGIVTISETAHRLSPETRELAARAISGEYGRQMKPADFKIDAAEMPKSTPNARYSEAVWHMAETTPLRVIPGEMLVGAAPFLEATQHMTPGTDM